MHKATQKAVRRWRRRKLRITATRAVNQINIATKKTPLQRTYYKCHNNRLSELQRYVEGLGGHLKREADSGFNMSQVRRQQQRAFCAIASQLRDVESHCRALGIEPHSVTLPELAESR